ncbi:hypothetical protein FHW73_002585 [Luteimonas sp. RC10]|nr:hypothetical protein [Luteimonas sp. RC10]
MNTTFFPADMPCLPRAQREAAPCAQRAAHRARGHILD